jgi:glycosyltransferase involved in cell wall biosynthesis
MKQKKTNPLVSVIIPAYNAGKYLGEAIDSILSQTYNNIEVIIINDASKDDTLKIAEDYKRKDKRIAVYNNKTNLGIGKNRALGIELAKGDYICWQDADDISLPNRVAKQAEYLDNHKDVGVVGGFIHFFGEKGDGVVRKYEETDIPLRGKIFRYNPVAQPASMTRADVYNKVGTYNSDYIVSEDLEMLFRIGTRYHFANIQEIVLEYRQSNSSLTRLNLRRMEKSAISIRKRYSNNPEYNFTFLDKMYLFAQNLSISLPTKLRMFIFRIIRGDK